MILANITTKKSEIVEIQDILTKKYRHGIYIWRKPIMQKGFEAGTLTFRPTLSQRPY